MNIGQVFLSNEIKARGFGPKDMKATFKSKPESLLVTLYLGTVTQESVQHFSADGALMALGYGPSATTRVQYGLVDALRAVQPGTDSKMRDKIDAALAAADNFAKAAGPLIDPITQDAARFRFAMACAVEPEGPAALLAHQIGDELDEAERTARIERGETDDLPDLTSEQEQTRFLAVIDEARRRWGAIHG